MLAARAYQADLRKLTGQLVRLMLGRWAQIRPGDITASWVVQLPDVVAMVTAAQAVAAEMADSYMAAVLDDPRPPTHPVNPREYAGTTQVGDPLDTLLYRPVIDAKQRIAAGADTAAALRAAVPQLTMYGQTLVADAGRLSTSAAMGARPHVSGYYRMLTPPSCGRCAILAGKHFAYNRGFDRHPRCDCVHIPVSEADDSLLFDPRKAIEAGKVTGLSKADLRAIELGADPPQVVNAKRGMYTAGGASFTTTGTTRHAVAGARILARDAARAAGEDVSGRTFRNLTFTRLEAQRYTELFRKGKTYTRLTKTGRTQSYAYRFSRSRRMTPEQILRDAKSRDDAIRLLINHGYIL